jgi:hypothetical protein
MPRRVEREGQYYAIHNLQHFDVIEELTQLLRSAGAIVEARRGCPRR